ncbi:MAG: SLC13 family permease, partial [Pseudomonadota bacterium]
ALVAFAAERWRPELTALGTLVALLLVFELFPTETPRGVLTATELLAGFANPAVITVMALLVVGQAMVLTGAIEVVARPLVRAAVVAPRRTIAFALLTVLGSSAVLNNTPVVVIFIPIMRALAERLQMSPGRVMMPLSYIAMLGGMLTLVGSSSNLLVAAELRRLEAGDLGFFDMTVPGLALAAAGFAYVGVWMWRGGGRTGRAPAEGLLGSGRQFIAEVELQARSPLVGAESVGGFFPALRHLTLRGIERDGRMLLPPFDGVRLQPADVLIVAATRRVLSELLVDLPGQLPHRPQAEGERRAGEEYVLGEIMIRPASRLVGLTLELTGFEARNHVSVVGIQRRARMLRARTGTIRLDAGDVLLVGGQRQAVRQLGGDPDVVLLGGSTDELQRRDKAGLAIGIFAGILLPAALGLLPIVLTALVGVIALVATKCVNLRQAARALDSSVYLTIAAAIALGLALEATGGAALLAGGIARLVGPDSPALALSLLFLAVAMLTNILSNNACAVVFTPIAVSLASQVGAPALPFALAVLFAANCSFATPFGYQTNLLVMGPGNYRFNDFPRAGIPLTLMLWLVFSLVMPWLVAL